MIDVPLSTNPTHATIFKKPKTLDLKPTLRHNRPLSYRYGVIGGVIHILTFVSIRALYDMLR